MARVAVLIAVIAVVAIQLVPCNTKSQTTPPPRQLSRGTTTQGKNRGPPGGTTTATQSPTRPPRRATTQPPTGPTRPPRSTTTQPPTGPTRPPRRTTQPPTRPPRRTTAKRSSRPNRRTTTKPSDKIVNGAILNKEDLKKLDKSFDPSSTVNFDLRLMFDTDGKISDSFVDMLGGVGEMIANLTETKYKDVLDLNGTFGGGKGNPEDVTSFFNLLAQVDMDDLDKLIDTPDRLVPDDIPDYNILAAVNKTMLQDKLSEAPASVTDKICEDLQKGYTNRQNTKEIVKALDCVASLAKSGKKPEGDLAGAIARNEIEKKRIRDWNRQDWEKSIDGGYFTKLPPEAAKFIPVAVVKNKLSELNTLVNDKRMLKIVSEKLAEDRGSGPIRASDLGSMGSMAAGISAKEFKKMDQSEMMNSIATLKGIAKDMNRAQRAQVKKHLKGGTITKDNITDAIGLMDKHTFDQIPSSEVVAALADLGQEDLDEETARLAARKLKSSADYDEPSDWTNDKIKQSGSITKGLPAKMLKEATNVDFASLLTDGTVAGMELPKDSARAVVERIFSDSGKSKMVQSDIENLGDNIKGLRQDRVKDIDPDDLLNAMDNMKDTISKISSEMDKSAKSAMINKIGSATGGLAANAEKLGCLLKDVPVAKLKNESDADFGDMSGQTTRDFNCSEEQSCAVLYKVVKNTIGEPGLNNSLNYTKLAFMNLGKVMCGMTVDDLKKLPPTSDLIDVVEILLDTCELSGKKKAVLKDKVEYRFGLVSGVAQTATSDDVEKVSGLLMHFDVTNLDSLGSDLCTDIVDKMGEKDTTEVTSDKLDKLAKYGLKCMGKENGNLTQDDLDSLGSLAAGLPKGRVSDVDPDALLDVVSEMDTSALNSDKRKQWMKEVKDTLGGVDSDSSDLLLTLGPLAVELTDQEYETISDESWSSAGVELIEASKDLEEKFKKRETNGVKVTDKDRELREEKKGKINIRIKDAYKNTATSSRRKRSVTSLSCTDMQSLGSGVTSMTTSELEAMTDSDFLDCASFIGETSTWSSAQLSSLLTVASRSGTFGDSISWTADNVYEAGIIVQALSSSEITALTGLDLDAMSSMGQHEGWGETQLTSGFSRWLSLNKGDDVSTVTSTELIGIGHFACGASTSDISSIPSAEYSYAASYIGALTSCTDSQFVAYADLAEIAFGSISSWDTSIISTIGSVIGGLTANELGSLSTSQVAAITPSSIAQIPSSVFVGFTVDQLSGFSVAQAQATTSSQQAGLSQAQLNALIAAGATIDSSVTTIHASIVMMFASTLLALLL